MDAWEKLSESQRQAWIRATRTDAVSQEQVQAAAKASAESTAREGKIPLDQVTGPVRAKDFISYGHAKRDHEIAHKYAPDMPAFPSYEEWRAK